MWLKNSMRHARTVRGRGIGAVIVVVLLASTAARAADRRTATAPPSRPAQLTVEQYEALQQLSAAPEHAVARQVPASYSQQVYNKLQEPSSYITYIAIGGTILGLVICAGPY
jgi:hypothetical protein